jgi:hypothetical protein
MSIDLPTQPLPILNLMALLHPIFKDITSEKTKRDCFAIILSKLKVDRTTFHLDLSCFSLFKKTSFALKDAEHC